MWQYLLYLILAFYAYRAIVLLLRKAANKTLMIVFGSGGHTAEMKRMISSLDFSRFDNIVCVAAATDTLSKVTVSDHFSQLKKDPAKITWKVIPRSREVKQSYFTSIFTTIHAMIYCFFLILNIQPCLVYLTFVIS